ncbi:hypothetical protein [Zobellia alginiliquefaciens]|uniref:hypothetical protein n=1 Tax=Zobellia alginiliquefaciens TaxID=3032586 RepID=UPI0023E0FC84|nr:hypothetical protein [Zobellia alginiliquefaciens]
MKTTFKLTRGIFFLIFLVLSSCTKEGPEGPMGATGPAGPQGEQGIAGQDGANGQDGIDGEPGVDGRNGVDGQDAEFNPIYFKVAGSGFAVKDLNGGTTIEADIWEIIGYDSANGFNRSTKRYVVQETGYYFLQAYIRQSNNVTNAFFRLHFNIDVNARFNQIVDGDDTKINVSGIFYLTEGQEVFLYLRNYSSDIDVRVDGTGSWFEGYKIN